MMCKAATGVQNRGTSFIERFRGNAPTRARRIFKRSQLNEEFIFFDRNIIHAFD